MAEPDLDVPLLPPISPESPCGPDLDLDGDTEFLNFLAAWEGQMPRSFYSFKRDALDFAEAFRVGEGFLRRTIHVRLIVLLAKLSVLNHDIPGFARWVGILAWLLRAHWEDVNPRAEDGDYMGRLMLLLTLEEVATVELPLQYSPLLETPREGSFTFRAHLVATGVVTPRVVMGLDARGQQVQSDAEKFMPSKTIDRLLRDIEIDKLSAAYERMRGLGAALQSIYATTMEQVGFEQAVQFPKLSKLVGEMTEFLRDALARRDPTLAPSTPTPGVEKAEVADSAPSAPSSFSSLADVDAALGAALGYFQASEPSSPAFLLIRQARETLGKNLYEVMKLLAPAHADNARVFVGPDSAFTVPVKSLSSTTGAELVRAQSTPAASRAVALALIDDVATHMQRVEPSSPAPYLLQRARSLASRDFLSLLQDVLPEDALASLKKGK